MIQAIRFMISNICKDTGLQTVELQLNAKNKNAYHSYIMVYGKIKGEILC